MIRLLLLVSLLAAGAASADDLEVSGAWVREPPPGASAAAAYLTLRNPGGDARRLVGASSPACARAEIHRSVVEDGVARMEHVAAIDVPANGELVLAPGGLHLMLIEPGVLHDGDEVPLVLELAGGETLPVRAVVRRHAGAHH